jgi:GGDEF domain-containing protein
MLAERMLAEVRHYHFRGTLPVTVSMGFAVLPPDEPERDWNLLMQRADQQLYKAKSEGRNRYCIQC